MIASPTFAKLAQTIYYCDASDKMGQWKMRAMYGSTCRSLVPASEEVKAKILIPPIAAHTNTTVWLVVSGIMAAIKSSEGLLPGCYTPEELPVSQYLKILSRYCQVDRYYTKQEQKRLKALNIWNRRDPSKSAPAL